MSWSQFTKIQKDSYEYCLENDLSDIDEKFIRWLIAKEGLKTQALRINKSPPFPSKNLM